MHRSSLFCLSSICSIFRFVNNNLPEKVKIPRYIFTFARQHYACKQESGREATGMKESRNQNKTKNQENTNQEQNQNGNQNNQNRNNR